MRFSCIKYHAENMSFVEATLWSPIDPAQIRTALLLVKRGAISGTISIEAIINSLISSN